MAEVVSFLNYTPPARFDAVAWEDAQIEEAATASGPWTVIDTVTLGTPDVNPASPAARSFTTSAGTAPDQWYRVSFVDGAANVSEPTAAVQNGGTASLYVTIDELKATQDMAGSYADADVILACEAASRVIDAATGQKFYTDASTRYFTVCYDRYINLGPVGSVSSVTVDTDGNGTYDTTFVQGTDFYLDPVNNPALGLPYTRLSLISQAGRVFPSYAHAVKITGTFGWSAVPAEVRQYARILAAKLLIRSRQAPFGFQPIAGDVGGFARIARTDPDFETLLGHLVARRLFV